MSLRPSVSALLLSFAVALPASAQNPAPASGEYKPRTLSPAPPMQVVDQGKGVATTQAGRGRLVVVTDTWDFGYVPQDAYITHRFILQNGGDDSLFIEEVKPTCGCTVASLEKNALAPGEKVPVTITVGTQKFSGLLTKKIHVISSDRQAARYPLTFKAQVGEKAGLELADGASIDLSPLTQGREKSLTASLTNRGGTPLQLAIAEAPHFLSATLSASHVAPEASVKIALAATSQPPAGPIKSSVTLELSGMSTTRLTIPITGTGASH